ncbi:YbaL family putative K(+) efflux transporter [Luteimonas vadosa]|uniref:YbaL family putative K(+) efflux transporter n=1 Tax=Luteimonas vadosa TaxID=1165507 RepID=A0ABP9DMN6_9GAMM
MPHETSLIAILCMGFVLAFVLGLAAQRLRVSPLVGYLLAGMIAGPYTPGFVADQELAPQLAEIGVILLMFGVGLKFSMRELLEVRAIAFTGALLRIAVATVMGWALGRFLGWSDGAGIVFGIALSIASTVVLLRTLEDRRLTETRIGRISVGWVVVEDLAMVMALVLLPALAGALGGDAVEDGPGVGTALVLTLAKVSAFVAFMLIVGRRIIPWVLERVASTGSRELFTLCVLALAMGVAFGAAALFGVSFALGAFFAGLLLNESEFGHKAANDSLPMRDAFAVLFFVSVGMLFDPMILVERPLEIVATVVIIVLGKSLVAYGILRAFGKTRSTSLVITTSLAQTGEFSFILAGLGVSLDILPSEGQDLILAGALISIMLNPFLFTLLDQYRARQGDEAMADAARQAMDAPIVPDDIRDHTILVGYGRLGSQLAGLLRERGIPLVVIEADVDLVLKARADGLPAVRGNVAKEAVLRDAVPERARMAIFAIPRTLEAGEAITRLKQINPEATVLARAHSDGEVKHLIKHGADGVVLAERELAFSLVEMVMATPPYRTKQLPSTA